MMARARQGVLPQRPVVDSRPEERNGHYIGGFLSRHALRGGEAGQYAAVLGLLLYVVGRPEFFFRALPMAILLEKRSRR
jgi:hypothetical protein